MLGHIPVDVPEGKTIFGYVGLDTDTFSALVSRLIVAEARNGVQRIYVPQEVVPYAVFDKIRLLMIKSGFVVTLIDDQKGGHYVLWLPVPHAP